ncbi:glycan biosynthesis hexose transferase WsfD [Paenarthrobacter sp. NCHU4564]|uniref:glycan biosynthesis hexose transferase WsfD n=1 Tax=Paenarthrobacter sp. NCHU4564 TaxID=3451353 RepID=UPI003F9E3E51
MVEARTEEQSSGTGEFAPLRVRPARGTSPGPVRRIARFLARLLGPGDLGSRPALLPAILAGLVAAVAMVVRLFVPSPSGMADQGDGHGLACSLGVTNVRPWDYSDFTRYIYPRWVPHEFFGEACGASGSGEPVMSSQLVLLWLGKLLTPLLGWGPGLDMRAVGLVGCVVFGALIAALVLVLPGRTSFRLLVAGLVVAVMADGVFAAFFISPYPEPAAFLGILGLAVALLHYWNGRRVRWVAVAGVVVAGAFLVSAKPSMVSWLPVLVLALLWVPAGRSRGATRTRNPGQQGWWRRRPLPLVAVVALVGVSAAVVAAQPGRTADLNLYNAVFAELLPHSVTPEEDLAWLGLDESFATASGTTAASAGSAVTNPDFHQFREQVTPLKLAGFYATHPERLIGMGERGISAMLSPELRYVGSFMEDSGEEPFAKDRRFPVMLGLLTAMKAAPVVLVAMQLLTMLLGLAVAFRRGAAIGRLAVVMVAGGWLHFWVVVLGSGQPEIYRQLIVTAFLAALCVPLLVALISILASDRGSSDPAVEM